MESLTGIIAFAHTAEHLSFVAAARHLGLSASAVGKSVTRLEQKLGVRLLQRSTRALRLTAEGQVFYTRCKRIVGEVNDAEAALAYAAKAPRGLLRVSVPTIGYHFLMPHVQTFQRLYPEIELDIDFEDRVVDIIREGYDVVIRSGHLVDSAFSARRIGAFGFALVASPAYFATHGIPKHPSDLAEHACIRYRFVTTGKLQPWVLDGMPKQTLPSSLTVNNTEALLRAGLRGLGICYMPTFLAASYVKHGRLQRVLESYVTTGGYFSVVWPARRHAAPKVKAFVDFVSRGLF